MVYEIVFRGVHERQKAFRAARTLIEVLEIPTWLHMLRDKNTERLHRDTAVFVAFYACA